MIKKFDDFNEINESINWNENEEKAIKKGYNIGDIVYNKKMKKELTVVRSARVVVDDKKDRYCTLASIGEFPKEYSLVKSFKGGGDEEEPKKDKEDMDDDSRLIRIKNNIKNELKNLKNISKDSDLIDDLEKLLKKL